MNQAKKQQIKLFEEKLKISCLQAKVNNFLKDKDSDEIISVKFNTETIGMRTLYTVMVVYTEMVEIKE